MFSSTTYVARRTQLAKEIKHGLILLPGNSDQAFNYKANTYRFRQDSSFLYYFGLDEPELCGIIDLDENETILFGHEATIDDVIWMGPSDSLSKRGEHVGVTNCQSPSKLKEHLHYAEKKGRKIHYLPPYRPSTLLRLEEMLGIPQSLIPSHASTVLIHAVCKARSVKTPEEIVQVEEALETAYLMHTRVMKMARPGIREQEIAGIIEGIAISRGGTVSFPVILSQRGEVLHNHSHDAVLEEGRLLLTDAGAETVLHYASDITRVTPVGGKFSAQQKEIYQLVLDANLHSIESIRPGVPYRDIHLAAALLMAEGLKSLGLMQGDMHEAVQAGAHALFFPHGLGHMLGLDVHDLEALGEDHFGYDEEIQRSKQFGLAFLRLGKRLQENYLITVEPGLYFIPALIELWKKEKRHEAFIRYEKLETYRSFGGIRLEDNVLVTRDGAKVLGKPIPKTIEEVEEAAR